MTDKNIIVVFVLSMCAWQAYAAVNCTAEGAGRHADPADLTCKNYTLCIYSSASNSYFSYDYVCPTTSLFSPLLGQCTANYNCTATATGSTNSTATDSTNSTTTTTDSTNSTNTTTSLCTADGYIADPNAANCSGYILCVNINNTFIETSYPCPDSTFYNPNTTLCDPDYTCVVPFTCTSAGRFPNTSDTTCQSYYFCVLLSDGTFTQYNYTCPSSSLFNPTSGLCTASYTCTN